MKILLLYILNTIILSICFNVDCSYSQIIKTDEYKFTSDKYLQNLDVYKVDDNLYSFYSITNHLGRLKSVKLVLTNKQGDLVFIKTIIDSLDKLEFNKINIKISNQYFIIFGGYYDYNLSNDLNSFYTICDFNGNIIVEKYLSEYNDQLSILDLKIEGDYLYCLNIYIPQSRSDNYLVEIKHNIISNQIILDSTLKDFTNIKHYFIKDSLSYISFSYTINNDQSVKFVCIKYDTTNNIIDSVNIISGFKVKTNTDLGNITFISDDDFIYLNAMFYNKLGEIINNNILDNLFISFNKNDFVFNKPVNYYKQGDDLVSISTFRTIYKQYNDTIFTIHRTNKLNTPSTFDFLYYITMFIDGQKIFSKTIFNDSVEILNDILAKEIFWNPVSQEITTYLISNQTGDVYINKFQLNGNSTYSNIINTVNDCRYCNYHINAYNNNRFSINGSISQDTSSYETYFIAYYDMFTTNVVSYHDIRLSIYPNPNRGSIFISKNNLTPFDKVLIYDLNGRLLRFEMLNNNEIKLLDYTKGLIFVKMYLNEKIYNQILLLE